MLSFYNGSIKVVRHSENQETPLPIYLGLMIHAITRKWDIIDKLHKLGLSISYDRELKLSMHSLANAVCQQYEDDRALKYIHILEHYSTNQPQIKHFKHVHVKATSVLLAEELRRLACSYNKLKRDAGTACT